MLSRLGRIAAGALIAGAILPSCAHYVWMMVPARVELARWPRLGIVELAGDDARLRKQATVELQQRLLEARPGIQLVALGSVEATDPAALAALARERGLDGVLTGRVEVSKVTPSLGITSSLVEVQARAEVTATLTAELVEVESGATVWVRTGRRTATVASAGFDTTGAGSLGVTDVTGVKADMVRALAHDLTEDFRDRYLRKKPEHIPPTYRVTYPDGVEVYVPPDVGRL